MKALNTDILPISRVWPEDWTGLALKRILINYRWLSNCGKLKPVQVSLLTSFSNQVFSLNTSNGREVRETSLVVQRDRGHNVRNNLDQGNQEEQQLLGQGPICLLTVRITTDSSPNSPSPENLQKHPGGIKSVGNKRTRNEW